MSHKNVFRALAWASLLLALLPGTRADEARLRCTADTNVSSFESERDFNYGQSSALRLKGIQMLALFQFDTKPIAGWRVKTATLHLRYAHSDRKIRTVGISTISAPWYEGTGTGERKPGETCFSWNVYGKTRWAGPSTDFTDVSFTAGHTRASYADAQTRDNDWITVPVEPGLVQALVAGVSYGLAVSDEKGQTAANNDVYSREQSGSEPYLVVEGMPAPATAPAPVTHLKATADRRHADFGAGAIQATWTTPHDTFAFEVRYAVPASGPMRDAPRSVIPAALPGQQQMIRLGGLKPASPVAIEVVPVGPTGARGTPARAIGRTSASKLEPSPLRRPTGWTGRTPDADSAPLRVWAYPDTEKADPISGNLLEEVGADRYSGSPAGRYRRANAVWDGQTIRLFAARNEIVGFHLLVEAATPPLRTISVRGLEVFETPAPARSWKGEVNFFRDWYVKDGAWYPEVCVPLSAPFDIPAADNAVPGQRNQSVFVEMRVPRGVAPGVYRSALTVSAGGSAPVRVLVEIVVNPLTLPDTLSFDVSLNTYGTVGHLFGIADNSPAYRTLEKEYHRMAHRHRATLGILGYSHSGTVSTNYAPPLAGRDAGLHVSDWNAWDAQFGPYLDGSAFAGLPRKAVPITHLYLPFHEAWPVDIRQHDRYQPTTTDYPAMIAEHALKAPPIEQEIDPELADGFVAVARQFAEHIRAKGWTRTQFQFYQNDKHYYKDPKTGGRGTSWWLLDEPNHRDDWLALAYFSRLFQKGIRGVSGVSMPHREDISRPQWQRNYLDNLVDLMVVSGELYDKGPRLREMQEQWGVRFWNYGTANAVRRSNAEAEAWAVRAWLAGADGIVPWQTVGADENFTQADETALLLPGRRFGIAGPVASLRLKALRRAQQDVEYLVLLARARSWDRAQTAAALRGILPIRGVFQQSDAEDAGNYSFGPLHAADFADARHAAADTAR